MKDGTKFSNITAGIFFLLLIIVVLFSFVGDLTIEEPPVIIETTNVTINTTEALTGHNVATGEVFSGDILSGKVIWIAFYSGTEEEFSGIKSDIEEAGGEVLAIPLGEYTPAEYFPDQPKHIKGNEYPGNTDQLNAYAKKHMIVRNFEDGFTQLVIETKKPLKGGAEIIFYAENNGRHCGGRLQDKSITKEITHLYDLENMNVYPNTCDWNWFKKLRGGDVKVGGYISSYDGNKIMNIYTR